MFTKIVLCMDGSVHAKAATCTAIEIARKFQAKILLIYVLDPISCPSTIPLGAFAGAAPIDSRAIEYLQVIENGALQHTATILEEAGIPYEVRSEVGHPGEVIVSTAEQEKAGLIIMGSRGMGNFQRLLLGSVSDSVVHHAPCPVLIVRGVRPGFKHVLLAADASYGTCKAAMTAVELVKTFGTTLMALHVADPPPTPVADHDHPGQAESSPTKEFWTVLQHIEPLARGAGIPCTVYRETGHPVETIVEFAEKKDADLIVLGSRGMGAFKRLVLGSVSDGVLHHAQCSVLIVR